jgi:hypothetical protein
MEDRFNKWNEVIEINLTKFTETFGYLNAEQLNWKPNSKHWSIGQIIEHLIKTTENYCTIPDLVGNSEFKPSFLTHFGFVPKMYGNIILKYVEPKGKKKVKTMRTFEPTKSNVGTDIFLRFKDSQEKLLKFIRENKDSITERKIVPSPVNRHIIYHFDTVIDILVTHQLRHFNQASNLLSAMGEK